MDKTLYGKLTYKGSDYNFVFKDNIIVLQPYEMHPVWEDFHDILTGVNYKSTETINLEGETLDGYSICFVNIKLSKNGRGSYRAFVPTYVVGSANTISPLPDVSNFKMIYFSGQCIDSLYNPHHIIEKVATSYDVGEEENSFIEIRKNKDVEKTINFNNDNISIKFKINWAFSYKNKNNVLILDSRMYIYFDKEQSINQIIEHYKKVQRLFRFLNNRSFICFNEILLYKNVIVAAGVTNEEKNMLFNYKLYITPPPNENIDFPDKRTNLLQLDDIINNFESIYNMVNKPNYYMLHYPNNKEDDLYVDADKFIQVSSAFESEFDELYPNYKSNKSTTYKELKNDLLSYIESKTSESSPKSKKYLNKFYETIKNLEGILSEQINHALEEFEPCIKNEKSRLLSIYELAKASNNDIAEAFANKRNNLSHGNIENQFSDMEMISYLLLRRLIHCISFKRAGFSIDDITSIIDKIF